MKKFGALALVIATAALGVLPSHVEATTPTVLPSHQSHQNIARTIVEDDPYTVLKPWIGTFSQVVKPNRRFLVVLDGFEPRERVRITIDSTNFNVRVWRNGAGLAMIRAPRTAGKYEIVAVGRTSGAEASTAIAVRRRR